jgi:PAS domain S-box-containing protein
VSPGDSKDDRGFDRTLLGELVDRAPDAVVVVDDRGSICYWNAGAQRIFGFSAADAIGESLDLIIPDRLRERHWSAFNQAVETGRSRYGDSDLLAVPARTSDGGTISIEFTVALLKSGDAVGHIGAVIRDVTARRALELELRSRIRELEEGATPKGSPAGDGEVG